MKRKAEGQLLAQHYWYKQAVIYELHVRAFYDSNGDGIGDFQGLIKKLDYLANLGVTALWLLPFYPSPRKDDGYDIADYMSIHPEYGTMKDFKEFLRQAHARGIKVITELVINHTSDQHVWFQRSRRAKPGTYWHKFYVWSNDPTRYKDARIIFKDFESANWAWDPIAQSYYWHRFYHHQPDLNYDNPEVQKQIIKVVDFWMGMGVDGMRLDAVPYIYERENTSCENLPETHEFIRKLRAHIDARYSERMLLCEANQWPEDAVAYFGQGDEAHMNFHFPLMPRLFMALRIEDRYSIVDIIKQTPEIPLNCQWATFLRNHDELTLEMVTDEERDYMYKVYASDPKARINLGIRRRLLPLLDNDRRQVELLNALLFSIVGTPVLYYGDEIGMGDNIYLGDRDGVRTPFQWSPDKNAGFSVANPQSLYLPVIIAPEYHYETINVENQQTNSHSLLWWMRRLIMRRKQYPALQHGSMTILYPDNYRVFAFLRSYQDQDILVVANLSRNVQCVELDLSEFKGRRPIEIFGHSDFPLIGELPYFLTLGSYGYYWFELQKPERDDSHQGLAPACLAVPVRETAPMTALRRPEALSELSDYLRTYIAGARWFRAKSSKLARCQIDDVLLIPDHSPKLQSALLVVSVYYADKTEVDLYLVAVSHAEGERSQQILRDQPRAVLCQTRSVQGGSPDGLFYNAFLNQTFGQELLMSLLKRKSIAGLRAGRLYGEVFDKVKKTWLKGLAAPKTAGLEQTNTSLSYGNELYLKVYRKIEEGENPEIEMGRYLSAKGFAHAAPYIGSLSYSDGRKTYSLAVLHRFVESEHDAWHLMLDRLGGLADEILAQAGSLDASSVAVQHPLCLDLRHEVHEFIRASASYDLTLAALLGQRLAELHLSLAQTEERAFAPDPYTPFYQRGLYQSLYNQLKQTMGLLTQAKAPATRGQHAEPVLGLMARALGAQSRMNQRFGLLKQQALATVRIRIHGDCHLGQIRYTGKDFTLIDFEGEPNRPLSERRIKKTPLTDVAGILRSFDYCYRFYLKQQSSTDEERQTLKPWFHQWMLAMSHEFLKSYRATVDGHGLVPSGADEFFALLEVLLLDKALYEVRYEMGSRPDWVDMPLEGLMAIMGDQQDG